MPMSHVVELSNVNPKFNTFASKYHNITMAAHLFHLFTKWPRHIFCERLFSPRQNEVVLVDQIRLVGHGLFPCRWGLVVMAL